jgi:hypothetical protein
MGFARMLPWVSGLQKQYRWKKKDKNKAAAEYFGDRLFEEIMEDYEA